MDSQFSLRCTFLNVVLNSVLQRCFLLKKVFIGSPFVTVKIIISHE